MLMLGCVNGVHRTWWTWQALREQQLLEQRE